MPQPTSDSRPIPALPPAEAEAELKAFRFDEKGTVFEGARDVAALLWAAPWNRTAQPGEVTVLSETGELRTVEIQAVRRTHKAYFACPTCGFQEITRTEVRDRLPGRARLKACRNCSLLGVRYPDLARFAVGFDPLTVAAHAKLEEQVQFRCSVDECKNTFYRWLHNQASFHRDNGVLPRCTIHGGR